MQETIKQNVQVQNDVEEVKPFEWKVSFIFNTIVRGVIITETEDEDLWYWELQTKNLLQDSIELKNEIVKNRLFVEPNEEPFYAKEIKGRIHYGMGHSAIRYRSKVEIKNRLMSSRKYCVDFYRCMVHKLINLDVEVKRAEEIAEKFAYLYFFNPAETYQDNYINEFEVEMFEPVVKRGSIFKKRLKLTLEEILTWYINDLCDWLIKDRLDIIDLEYREAWEEAEEKYVLNAFRKYRKNKAKQENLCLSPFPDIRITEDETAYLRKCIKEYHDEKNQQEKLNTFIKEVIPWRTTETLQEFFAKSIFTLNEVIYDEITENVNLWSFMKYVSYDDLSDINNAMESNIINSDSIREIVCQTTALLGEKVDLSREELSNFMTEAQKQCSGFQLLIKSKYFDKFHNLFEEEESSANISRKLTFLYFFESLRFFEYIAKKYMQERSVLLVNLPGYERKSNINLQETFLRYQEAFVEYLLNTCLTDLEADYANAWNKIEAERMAKFQNMKNLLE